MAYLSPEDQPDGLALNSVPETPNWGFQHMRPVQPTPERGRVAQGAGAGYTCGAGTAYAPGGAVPLTYGNYTYNNDTSNSAPANPPPLPTMTHYNVLAGGGADFPTYGGRYWGDADANRQRPYGTAGGLQHSGYDTNDLYYGKNPGE